MVGTCGTAFRVSWVHTANVRTKPRQGHSICPRPDIRVTLSIVLSDSLVLLFLLREKEKEAKRKCHTNIPAANILTLLPAAGVRKGGFLKKAPF